MTLTFLGLYFMDDVAMLVAVAGSSIFCHGSFVVSRGQRSVWQLKHLYSSLVCSLIHSLVPSSPHMSAHSNNNNNEAIDNAAVDDGALATLLGMGFDASQAAAALRLVGGAGGDPLSVEYAVNYLLTGEAPPQAIAQQANVLLYEEEPSGDDDVGAEEEEDDADFFLDGRLYHNPDNGCLVFSAGDAEGFHFESTEAPPWVMFGSDDNTPVDPPHVSMRLVLQGYYPTT
jgi:hypothetical protein